MRTSAGPLSLYEEVPADVSALPTSGSGASSGRSTTAGSGSSGLMTTISSNSSSPVPAGILRPMITFSLRPRSSSIAPLVAAIMSTRVVSWNEAAEMKLSVVRAAFVMPRSSASCVAGFSFFEGSSIPRFSSAIRRFSRSNSTRDVTSASRNLESPGSSTLTRWSICRTIISMCLSLIFTPCSR